MKLLKLTTYILLICAAIPFASCKKDRQGETKNVTINANVAAAADYQLSLSQYGDADDNASITIPATNASISRIDNSPTGFAPIYHYTADATKFNATDKVVITIDEGGRGGRCHQSNKTVITINFTIQ